MRRRPSFDEIKKKSQKKDPVKHFKIKCESDQKQSDSSSEENLKFY